MLKKVSSVILILTLAMSFPVQAQQQEVSSFDNTIYSDMKESQIDDVIIKESGSGALQKGRSIYVDFDGLIFDDSKMKVEVTDGDLKLDSFKTDGETIEIAIKSESTKASTIKISGLYFYTSTNYSFGSYDLRLLTQRNEKYPNNTFNGEDEYIVLGEDFIKLKENSNLSDTCLSWVLGENNITVKNKNTTNIISASSTLYFDEDGNLMIPLRPLISTLFDNFMLSFNSENNSIMLSLGSKIISINLDKNSILVNGIEMPLSSKAIIKNGVTYISLNDISIITGISNNNIKFSNDSKTLFINK